MMGLILGHKGTDYRFQGMISFLKIDPAHQERDIWAQLLRIAIHLMIIFMMI